MIAFDNRGSVAATSGRARGSSAQAGFSLLEILIAVLVLSIGLLGLAGLQTVSLQANQTAFQTSQANFLAMDMMDRMRANRTAAENGNYDIAFGDDSDSFNDGGSVNDADRSQWLDELERVLPGAIGANCDGDPCGASVSVNAANREATIVIRWIDERREPGDDQRLSSFTTVSRL